MDVLNTKPSVGLDGSTPQSHGESSFFHIFPIQWPLTCRETPLSNLIWNTMINHEIWKVPSFQTKFRISPKSSPKAGTRPVRSGGTPLESASSVVEDSTDWTDWTWTWLKYVEITTRTQISPDPAETAHLPWAEHLCVQPGSTARGSPPRSGSPETGPENSNLVPSCFQRVLDGLGWVRKGLKPLHFWEVQSQLQHEIYPLKLCSRFEPLARIVTVNLPNQ
jgi:hypothetical protein